MMVYYHKIPAASVTSSHRDFESALVYGALPLYNRNESGRNGNESRVKEKRYFYWIDDALFRKCMFRWLIFPKQTFRLFQRMKYSLKEELL